MYMFCPKPIPGLIQTYCLSPEFGKKNMFFPDLNGQLIWQYVIELGCMYKFAPSQYLDQYELLVYIQNLVKICFFIAQRASLFDSATWWRHQMEIFSALLALCAGNSPVNSPHKGQCRGALMFSLICAWINSWVNNQEIWDAIALIITSL